MGDQVPFLEGGPRVVLWGCWRRLEDGVGSAAGGRRCRPRLLAAGKGCLAAASPDAGLASGVGDGEG